MPPGYYLLAANSVQPALSNQQEDNAINSLSTKLNKTNIKFTNKITDISKSANIIFIAQAGKISSTQLNLIMTKLKVMNCNFLGWTYMKTHY